MPEVSLGDIALKLIWHVTIETYILQTNIHPCLFSFECFHEGFPGLHSV